MVLFPLTTCLHKGLLLSDKKYTDYFKIHGINRLQLFTLVKIPFARPQIFSGLKIASGIAGVGAIGGEWAGAQQGLGVFMQVCRRNFDLEGVCASIVCLLLLSLSFYYFVNILERFTGRRPNEKTVTFT